MKVIIIGGVAGGASCASRLRRLDEKAEILLVERGPYISYANCGLPYHIGGVIEKENDLLIADEKVFKAFFEINVRINCEAIDILADEKKVVLRDVLTGKEYTETYDQLVLSPGAKSVRPPLPGIDLPGLFHVRNVPDARKINEWIEKGQPFLSGMYKYSSFQTLRPKTRAVVVGGGFIGIETAENLMHRGFEVTLLQRGEQILLPIDVEMARPAEAYLRKKGINIILNDGATAFAETEDGKIEVQTNSGGKYMADVVILAIGVRPDTTLAKMAGIDIGERGGIVVDEQMRTSNPDIYAVGDVVEVTDFVTNEQSLIALAGPANRQGRIAADAIVGRKSTYRGTQGTSIIGFFGGTVAWTGASEKTLVRLGDTDFEKIFIYPNSNAAYYPGAKPIAIKVIFRKSNGKLLGAQALGLEGVDKRISVIAAYLQMGATIYDLQEAELCYAPQYGSAKDPVNFAGMVSEDVLNDDMPISHWAEAKQEYLLDVREPFELTVENITGSVNIPFTQLRSRLSEIPKDKTIHIFCRTGHRAYYATRILLQNGFKAKNVSGGMLSLAQSYLFDNIEE